MQALMTAATGMLAQELNVEVIANNIANLRTTGFKRQRAEFQDLLYQDIRRVGSSTSDSGTVVPSGVQVGSGVRTSATYRIHSQGSVTRTDKETDVAIRGEGFLNIQLPDGRTGYTRDGTLALDPNGTLVTADGFPVEPQITVPQNATNLTINNFGEVQVNVPGQNQPQILGQIQLSSFINKAGLDSIGDNLFVESGASGAPNTGNPGDEGLGTLLQSHVEEANVVAVAEISDLIAAQRAYEMNARVIRAADEMLSATANIR